jgi:hypothetical protein
MNATIRVANVVVLTALCAGGCALHRNAQGFFPSPQLGFASTPRTFGFRTVAVPGAKRTIASGINDAGDIAGAFDDSVGSHGFRFRRDSFTTVDFPGASWTAALGIGAHGEIVGAYRMPGEPAINFHGFLRTADGHYERIDAPPHTNTIAQRLLADGTILGCVHDADFGASMHGSVLRGPHDETTALASMHNGATPGLRRIVGLYNYAPAERSAAFVIDDGRFTPLVVPGSTATTAWDVNGAGEIAGSFRDSITAHAFVLTSLGFVRIDVPGSTLTRAFGINNHGVVVGSFESSGRTSGFIATPK